MTQPAPSPVQIGAEPKPYYMDGVVTLYHADCREVLPTLAPVDLVVTDPPYGIQYVSGWRLGGETPPIAGDASPCLDVLPLLPIARGGAIYWFCREDVIGAFNAAAFHAGLTPRRALIWDKGNWTSGDLEGDWAVQCETIAWACSGRHLLRGSRPSNLLRVSRGNTGANEHPTVKPEGLLEKIIAVSSDEDSTVLDPFCGSGTSLVAAKRLGRKAIGIELEEKYCEIAANRCRQGALTEMFR